MFVCAILYRSLCKCTVSSAFGMSSAIAIVFSGVSFLTCRNYCLQGCYGGVFCLESVLVCVAL